MDRELFAALAEEDVPDSREYGKYPKLDIDSNGVLFPLYFRESYSVTYDGFLKVSIAKREC